jgi:hypothetical protein
MKLDIIGITNRGKPDEHLALAVRSDTDLSNYVVLVTRYITPQAISRIPKSFYWFPAKPVKAGDVVLLHTGTGVDTATALTDGKSGHHFYRGLPSPVWNATGDCAVLLEIDTWKTSAYE